MVVPVLNWLLLVLIGMCCLPALLMQRLAEEEDEDGLEDGGGDEVRICLRARDGTVAFLRWCAGLGGR